jgi:hypothetical protein
VRFVECDLEKPDDNEPIAKKTKNARKSKKKKGASKKENSDDESEVSVEEPVIVE